MNIIKPITVTSALIGAGCTLTEDPTAAWTSGTYAIGDLRHVVATHRVYKCAVAGSSSISPELDSTRWVDMKPTNKFAPFDIYTSTAATTTSTDIVYPITARFCNALAIYGLVGANYLIEVRDAVGGAVIWTRTGTLRKHGQGWYSYYFGTRTAVTKLAFFNLPIRPAAEVTITISAGASETRAVGLIALGKLKPLIGGFVGGTQYGATAEPVSYSYIKTTDDGTTTIVRRHSGTNLRCKVFVEHAQADAALLILQEVLDTPVAWVASDLEDYSGLSTFGIASSSPVQYDGPGHAYIDINVKGLV